MVELFSELGRRMTSLAMGDNADYQDVIAIATSANPWFSSDDIRRAAVNIAADMLVSDRLNAWLAAYSQVPVAQPLDVLVIMAGNIPFVGLQDLICVLVSGHRATVKLSSKDSVLMRWVIAQLIDIEPLTPVLFDGEPDAVIAMGGDDTISALRTKYTGLPMLLRGHRSSLAVLDGSENEVQLTGLADDILTFSGLGCRNVSLVFVPREYDFSALQSIIGKRINALNLKYRNNLNQSRAKLLMTGVKFIDCGACLLVENKDFSPSITICNYAFYDSKDEVKVWIAKNFDRIQCVAGKAAGETTELGKTQRPTLFDYPDGVDTVKFLLSIK